MQIENCWFWWKVALKCFINYVKIKKNVVSIELKIAAEKIVLDRILWLFKLISVIASSGSNHGPQSSRRVLHKDPHPFRIHCSLCSSQGLYSLSGKTSYRKISWSLEAARFVFRLFQSLWNLTTISAAMLPRCLSNFRTIRSL